MTDLCPMTYAKYRVAQRGYQDYRFVFRDLQLVGLESRIIESYNELWFILEAAHEIRVQSDYGVYDYGRGDLSENMHEHADRIQLINRSSQPRRIRFLQVLMQ